jgi:hypothetical protein
VVLFFVWAEALRRGDFASLERLVARSWTDERMGREQALELARRRIARGAPAPVPEAWVVRSERSGVEATEEARLSGALVRARFTLAREGGGLRFASGLL